MPRLIDPAKKAQYLQHRQLGYTQAESARRAGITYTSARGIENRNVGVKASLRIDGLQKPIAHKHLTRAPKRALNDIGYFARRYYGMILLPFHYEDTERVTEWASTPQKEFTVINIAPGTGKTTFYTRVLPAWLTCRDRRIRGMVGSASHGLAARYVRQLRSDFTRTIPVQANSTGIEQGWAVDARACLIHDYGRFRPDNASEDTIWRQDNFIVDQIDAVSVSEKESTWQAFGPDSSVIGTRVNFAVWDDLYDVQKFRSRETKQSLYDWWSNTAEERLEPNGLLLLVGQRLAADDIYHYALNQKRLSPDGQIIPKYHHIVHKAHYDELCRGAETHTFDAEPWPVGCLLFPRRVTWTEVSDKKLNRPDVFEVVYQQNDYIADDQLVKRVWVDGGTDPDTGECFDGCWDEDRDICEYPHGLTPPLYSMATVDPAPSNFWACIAEGSLVLTRRGEVPVEQVSTTDSVMTRGGWHQVIKSGSKGARSVITLHLSNGRCLTLTPDHRLLTTFGWKPASSTLGATLLSPVVHSTLTADTFAFIDNKIVSAVRVPTRTVSFSNLSSDMSGPRHVVPMGFYDQVGRSHARGVTANMTQFSGEWLSTGLNDTVGEPMGQMLTRTRINNAVSAGSGSLDPDTTVTDLDGSLQDIVPVVSDDIFTGVEPVGTNLAADRCRTSKDISTLAEVHVVSITHGTIPRQVYDLTVTGNRPEFVVEGIIAHNCEWWLYHPDSETRYLLDLFHGKQGGNDLLDWINGDQKFAGLMEDWQTRSLTLGIPISHWIVEINAAQKFLLQYEHVKRWARLREVQIVPHTTGINKSNSDLGVTTIASKYKYGQVRLPARTNEAKRKSERLVADAVNFRKDFSHSTPDDCVMAQWFLEFNLPRLAFRGIEVAQQSRPAWVSEYFRPHYQQR
jgi:uncharacterized protein YndB with AHSA1/START domain